MMGEEEVVLSFLFHLRRGLIFLSCLVLSIMIKEITYSLSSNTSILVS